MATTYAYVPSTQDGLTVTNIDEVSIHVLDDAWAKEESPVEKDKLLARICELWEKLTDQKA